MANVLYQHRIHLRSAFRMFDVDNDGQITRDEFANGLRAFNVLLSRPITDVQIDELMNALDRNRDGSISFKEFLQGFSIVDTATNRTFTPHGV